MSARPECSVEGCDKPRRARGYCAAHYQRWRRWGESLSAPPRPVPTPALVIAECREQFAIALREAFTHP